MSGFIKINRRLLKSDMWTSEKFTKVQAWIDLIGLANWKDSFIRVRGIKVEVKRGECGWSTLKLAKRWQWSRGKVTRFLNELEMEHMIVQQTDRVSSLIKVINYELYQGNGTTDDTTDGQQTGHYRRKVKKNKEVVEEKKQAKKESSTTIEFWEKNCGLLTEYILSELVSLESDHGEDNLLKAIKIAVESNARNVRYVKGILDREKAAGYSWQRPRNKDGPPKDLKAAATASGLRDWKEIITQNT